jgi:L-cysteine/cystine lyase
VGLAAIAAHLQPRTRLLVISHVLWNTGQVLPLAAIADLCHQHRPQPVWVLVDGAQAVGMLPLNLEQLGVDFYAFTGHKWWCGPAGLGGLYVNPAALADLRPTFIGWRGITTDGAANPTGWLPNGQRFEVATSDYSLYAGLATAIATQHQWGTPEQRYQRIRHLSQQLWTALGQIPQVSCLSPTPPESGLVSFQLGHRGKPDPAWHRHLVEQLEDRGLLLRILLSPHCLRACTHYLTLESEVAHLVECIQAIVIKQFVTKRTY